MRCLGLEKHRKQRYVYPRDETAVSIPLCRQNVGMRFQACVFFTRLLWRISRESGWTQLGDKNCYSRAKWFITVLWSNKERDWTSWKTFRLSRSVWSLTRLIFLNGRYLKERWGSELTIMIYKRLTFGSSKG